jgi:hypothetical protein
VSDIKVFYYAVTIILQLSLFDILSSVPFFIVTFALLVLLLLHRLNSIESTHVCT